MLAFVHVAMKTIYIPGLNCCMEKCALYVVASMRVSIFITGKKVLGKPVRISQFAVA